MTMIVGRCPHGIIMSAAVEGITTHDELDDMAATYKLERVETASLDEPCLACAAQYQANIQLLAHTETARAS